jgi:hypothetical protein
VVIDLLWFIIWRLPGVYTHLEYFVLHISINVSRNSTLSPPSIPRILSHSLRQLTTDNAWHVPGRMRVGEEARRVGLNLLQREAGAGVLTVGNDASGERSSHAAHGILDDIGT